MATVDVEVTRPMLLKSLKRISRYRRRRASEARVERAARDLIAICAAEDEAELGYAVQVLWRLRNLGKIDVGLQTLLGNPAVTGPLVEDGPWASP